MGGATEIVLGTVFPIAGCVTASVMYCSPVRAVWACRQKSSLGSVQPIPFTVTFASTAIWTAYGFASRNPYLFPPNIIGFVANVFTSVASYALAPRRQQDVMLAILCLASLVIPVLGVISSMALSTSSQKSTMWGIVANIVTLLYYGAPLGTAWQVITSKNAASIYLPTCAANLLNALLWTIYGIAVGDFFIWFPNGVGAVFSVILILLCFIYPSLPAGTAASSLARRPSGESRASTDLHLLHDMEASLPHPTEQPNQKPAERQYSAPICVVATAATDGGERSATELVKV